MSEDTPAEEPKKKRGRPKGSKNKEKTEKPAEPKPAEEKPAEPKPAEEKPAEPKPAEEKPAEKKPAEKPAEIKLTKLPDSFTNKRGAEQIFRREMDEPEFWLTKEGRAPKFTVLSADEEQEISRKVEIPTNQMPLYKPENILSPEFDGKSNYEIGVSNQKEELKQRLDRLRNDPNASLQEIQKAEEDLKTLEYLWENFHYGMNVFRTAKGGRSKLKK